MDLDKDILHKGNKIYSPDNCVFVPHSVNSLIIKCDKYRGNLPIGVSFHKRDKIYQASCSNMKKEIFLGYYDNKIDAFNVYKKYKEELIKKIADKYKCMILNNLYTMLYNYSVEITN
jgi:hypothetical protein